MTRPLLPPVIALMAGIILADYTEVSLSFALVLLALLTLTVLFTLRRSATVTFIVICLSFFALGFTHMHLITEPPRGGDHIFHHLDGSEKVYEGVIIEASQRPDEGSLLTVSLYRLREGNHVKTVHGRVLLAVKTDQQFSYGDIVHFKARLKEPKSFKNPGVFDYAKYLRLKGIWARGTISRPSAICVIRSGHGNPLLKPFMSYREKLRELIAAKAPYPASAIIQACILGMQKNIPPDIMENFNRTGTSHIIAISGFNMAIVAGFAALLLRALFSLYPPLLLLINLQITSAIFASLFVVFYTFIAGAGISVVRATITILVFMFALILGRLREAENTLALAALIILIFSPYLLFDLSFQLSFSAVYALIYLTPRLMDLFPPLESKPSFVRKATRALYGFLIATLSATAGTMPILLYHFHRLSPLVIISNLLVIPILGFLVVPLSMLIMLTAPFSSTLTGFIVAVTAKLAELSIFIVETLAHLPYATLFLPRMGYTQIILYVLSLMFLISTLRTGNYRLPKLAGFGITILLFIFSLTISSGEKSKNLEVTILDVGQGQCIFIREPGGRAALIDGGGFVNSQFDVGKNVVTPFLLHRGVTHLSRIVISHPHPDHIGGLRYVVKNFPVDELWINRDTQTSEAASDLLEEAKRRGVAIKVVSAGFFLERPEKIKWEVLHPPPRDAIYNELKDENDRSLVIRLTYGNTSFLFPGDITEKAERIVMGGKKSIESQVLVVPHHGSRYSSSPSFLRRVRPQFACVSAGETVNQRLPHLLTINRFRAYKIPLYRTDLQGAITFTSDGHRVTVQTFSVAYER